ncbi:MAG: DNA mismatch repair protein MutS, partial [Cyanobacteriota bacterium]|nr:DNA mismatch repair protein MutS [Cyanobacteriota bacterium]
MGGASSQQLLLMATAELQGDLFAPPADATAADLPPPGTSGPASADPGGEEPADEDPLAAAAARPRQRRSTSAPAPAVDGTPPASSADPPPPAPEDQPRWHHHSLVRPEALTPMLRHYVSLKAAHPDRVLLYRLGDFFECFFEDAITVSRLLELALTGKEAGKAIGRVPMAGLPHHAVERYCGELVRRGLSVALCDQLETTPSNGQLLRRDITRVLTPGTVLEEGMLAARRNNWLCAVVLEGARWGLAVADVSTGDFRVSEQEGLAALHQELLRQEAAEVVWTQPPGGEAPGEASPSWCPTGVRHTPQPRAPFEAPQAQHRLRERYGVARLEGLGLSETPLALRAAGGLLAYLDSTQPDPGGEEAARAAIPLDRPRLWHAGDTLVLDAQTRRNLELTRTQMGGRFEGSLLWALDRTVTAMGARRLRRWVEAPLVEAAPILERQEGVSEL